MVGMAGFTMSPKAIRQQIASALTAVVQIARLSDGKRKIVSMQEITGMEGDVITLHEIFLFQQTGIGPDGTVLGHFRATGIRPNFVDRMRIRGVVVDDEIFDPMLSYE
jgi:pilus assembly protein CpaF